LPWHFNPDVLGRSYDHFLPAAELPVGIVAFEQGSYSITGRLSSVRQLAESELASGPTI